MEYPMEVILQCALMAGSAYLLLLVIGTLGPKGLGLGGIIPLRRWWPWPWRRAVICSLLFIPTTFVWLVYDLVTRGTGDAGDLLTLAFLMNLMTLLIWTIGIIISMYRQPEWCIEYERHFESESDIHFMVGRLELPLYENGDLFRRSKQTSDGWRIAWWGQLLPVKGTGFAKAMARSSLDRTPRYSTFLESRVVDRTMQVKVTVIVLDRVMTDDYKPCWLWVRRHSRAIRKYMVENGFEITKEPPPLKGPSLKRHLLKKGGD